MARSYPPTRHILRHLRLCHQVDDEGNISATMPILPDLLDQGGWLRLGAIATLVDSVAGHHGVMQVAPDWVATLQLGTVLARKAEGTEVIAECRPLRIGRNNVVTETAIRDLSGEIARATCTYARLPARTDNPSVGTGKGQVVDYAEDDEEHPRPMLDDYLRIDTNPDEPVIQLPHHSRIHNSFGSIQGGAVAVLVDAMAAHLCRLTHKAPARCTSPDVHYLAQAKAGPFRVEGEPLRIDQDTVTSRIRIVDVGNDNRLLDVATATAARIE
ncbi:MAG: hotdog fold thioesterase [Acidimicrobiales bacterium]|nr:hotdog fold thioesterase [Acidimicrobiales bacterium]